MRWFELRTAMRGAAAAAAYSCAVSLPTDSQGAGASLGWDPGAAGTAGYMYYCGEAARTYSLKGDVGNVTQARIEGLVDGKTYYCAVTAYDANKRESGYSNEVGFTTPTAAPVVSFTASPTSGTAPTTVAFSNTTTGSVSGWSWDFGDGTSSTQQSPTHVYSTPGQYSVALTATVPGGTVTQALAVPIQIAAPKKGKGKK